MAADARNLTGGPEAVAQGAPGRGGAPAGSSPAGTAPAGGAPPGSPPARSTPAGGTAAHSHAPADPAPPDADGRPKLDGGPRPPAPDGRGPAFAAPARIPLPDASGPREATTRLIAHGCWYPSADPAGTHVAFICDRGGVPQLWVGPVDGDAPRLLDDGPDPVREVSWSPDGRWIAYTTAPGGGEQKRVLCVRPDGSDRHIMAGAEPGSSAHLGCWAHDGSAVAVTVAVPTEPTPEATAEPALTGGGRATDRLSEHGQGPMGDAVLFDAARLDVAPPGGHGLAPPSAPTDREPGTASPQTTTEALMIGALGDPHAYPAAGFGDGLSAYLIDPDGLTAPVLLATEKDAATLRVCDLSRDGTLALLRRGPRGRREAVVLRTTDHVTTCVTPVADGDPWIGAFSPGADTLWLRSDAYREFAVLLAAELDPEGQPRGWSVRASRDDSDLELLRCVHDGSAAVLAWNVRGTSEVEIFDVAPSGATGTPAGATGATAGTSGTASVTADTAAGTTSALTLLRTTDSAPDTTSATPLTVGAPPERSGPVLELPHEVVTRIVDAGPGRLLLALSGSQRRPGIWWLPGGVAMARTPWSSADEDAVPPGRPPVRPVHRRLTARDGVPLNGWYYRAPGRNPGEPAPCVIYLHGGPEDQERPVLEPLYHEIVGRGVDVFAPDVRGSSGYGRSFVDSDLGEGRFAAIDDVADCAAHVVLSGSADPSRLAVMGRSYGGYLTFASLVWHPDLFRTGVAVCGMSDFATFFQGTEPWLAQSAAHKYGHPERDRELLRRLSPMSRIDALRAPLLAVHGEHDTNVPPGESEQFVRAARERGLNAELLTLRDEGHDFLRADNRRLFRRAAADWLQRHLTG
ncbi:prolyl oligopeptidase family serine peptidase [Streptomyces sp. IBSBF 3136]|uniref:prolyl oligopeptidase family serine peptidase n=1 Tax=Streptomyces sp. IBSBF 3136 TaxID=2903524 RepID=UPI002FDBC778